MSDIKKAGAERSPFCTPGAAGATFGTLTAENTNARTQSVLVTNENGLPLAAPKLVTVWLAEAADGTGVVGTAASGGLAAGTNGKLIATVVAGKVAIFQTDDAGQLDVTITDTGVRSLYLAVETNYGVAVTSAIAFA